MPRPFKNRNITGQPTCVVYKPAGIPARQLEWVKLELDEFESIKLLDHLDYDQAKAAEVMGVSRPTVTRIYASARKKIAKALTQGCAIQIEGGPVTEIDPSNIRPGGLGRGCGCGQGRGKGRRCQ